MSTVSKLQSPYSAKESNVITKKRRIIPFESLGESESKADRPQEVERHLDSSSSVEIQETASTSENVAETPMQRFLRHKQNDITTLQKGLEYKSRPYTVCHSHT